MRRLKKELWPYKVTVENYTNELETWLGENMGAFREKWNAVYEHDRSDYYFREQQDATWFALKWTQ
jgi:hypothetical protein